MVPLHNIITMKLSLALISLGEKEENEQKSQKNCPTRAVPEKLMEERKDYRTGGDNRLLKISSRARVAAGRR
jgi:hypothetical protein